MPSNGWSGTREPCYKVSIIFWAACVVDSLNETMRLPAFVITSPVWQPGHSPSIKEKQVGVGSTGFDVHLQESPGLSSSFQAIRRFGADKAVIVIQQVNA